MSYNIVSLFRTSGYSIKVRGFDYSTYLPQAHYRSKAWNKPVDAFDNRSVHSCISPFYGAPMRAKDTLLAQLMGNSKTASALIKGTFSGDYFDTTRDAIRSVKRQLPRYEQPHNSVTDPRGVLQMDNLKGKLISVEIEYYPTSLVPPVNRLTSVVSDGSLAHGGREIRRISWVNNGGRISGLIGMARYMKGARVDKSCGLHVHIDMRHIPSPGNGTPDTCDAAEIYDRLVKFYPMLKKLVPKSRWNNRYCKFVNNRDGSDSYRRPPQGQRYAAINWCSYYEHTTLEFRLAPGSTNMVKIESWALLCRHLVQWCSRRENSIPSTWAQFLAILPAWLASWCILRNLKLHGGLRSLDSRVASAADVSLPTDASSVE